MANTLLRLRMQQMFQKDKIASPRVILPVLKLQWLPSVHFLMAISGLSRNPHPQERAQPSPKGSGWPTQVVLLPQTGTIPFYLRRWPCIWGKVSQVSLMGQHPVNSAAKFLISSHDTGHMQSKELKKRCRRIQVVWWLDTSNSAFKMRAVPSFFLTYSTHTVHLRYLPVQFNSCLSGC